jgi:hypothetical protein
MIKFKDYLTEDKKSLDPRLQRYVYKLGPPQLTKAHKLWRGTSEHSGTGMASYGFGLYTTTSMKAAKEYGNVKEMDMATSLPKNCLIFKSRWDWEMFEQTLIYDMMKSTRRDQNDAPDKLIRKMVDPNIDGIQMGIGAGAFFVKWP